MSGAVTAPGRSIRGQVCGKHNVSYNQVLDPGLPGERESLWLPISCPRCEVELRRKIEADAEVMRLESEIVEETHRRAESDAGRDERIDAAVEEDMRKQAMEFVAEFYAMRRAEFEAYHNGQDWQRMYEQVKEDRRAEILEDSKKKQSAMAGG